MKKSMNIIINADDFGRSPEVNRAIINCIEHGYVTSTTIMANGKSVMSAIEYALCHHTISYGVHLVIDEYDSLTKSPIFVECGITDRSGKFIKNCLKNVSPTKKIKEAIYIEWCNQIDFLIRMGLKPSHIDSHHHVHTTPWLQEILLKISKKYEIRRVRLTQYRPISILLKQKKSIRTNDNSLIKAKMHNSKSKNVYFAKLLIFLTFIKSWALYLYMRKRYLTTDFFCSVAYFNINQKLLCSKNFKTIELMCHPGHESYIEETKMLCSIKAFLIPYTNL